MGWQTCGIATRLSPLPLAPLARGCGVLFQKRCGAIPAVQFFPTSFHAQSTTKGKATGLLFRFPSPYQLWISTLCLMKSSPSTCSKKRFMMLCAKLRLNTRPESHVVPTVVNQGYGIILKSATPALRVATSDLPGGGSFGFRPVSGSNFLSPFPHDSNRNCP